MKHSSSLPNLGKHVAVLLGFGLLSLIYFWVIVEGKTLQTGDTSAWLDSSREAKTWNAAHKDDPTLWTNSIFGGMPTYQITTPEEPNLVMLAEDALRDVVSEPVMLMWLYLALGYAMGLMWGFNKKLALIGALGIGLTSYNFIIIAAGHITKAYTIAYMPLIVGSVYMTLRRNILWGSIFFCLAFAGGIGNNHPQILYYTGWIVLFLCIGEGIALLREKQGPKLLKAFGALFLAGILGVGMNAGHLLSNMEYARETLRGGTSADGSSQGLDRDYITAWSYGRGELVTLLIPNAYGGSSHETLDTNSATAEHLRRMGVSDVEGLMSEIALPTYWGAQPFTSGPVYAGAVICLLFVMGFGLLDRRTLGWLTAVWVLSVFLAWGKNFGFLTDFFIDYIPLYNKFRTVAMWLTVSTFAMSLMAALTLHAWVYNHDIPDHKKRRMLWIGMGVTAGLCLLLILVPRILGDFVSEGDVLFGGAYEFLKTTLPDDRIGMLRADAWRSLLWILLGGAMLLFIQLRPQWRNWGLLGLGLFILIDLWNVDKRYLNRSNFTDADAHGFVELPADRHILQDSDYFRVFDVSSSPFNDARGAAFHHMVGGYHAAKLRIYQDLITRGLEPEMASTFSSLNNAQTLEEQHLALRQAKLLNMLNTKYLIYNPNALPLTNPERWGAAWIVDHAVLAAPDDEIDVFRREGSPHTMTVSDAAVLETPLDTDSTAVITLEHYTPKRLTYRLHSASTDKNLGVVFSEIYYPHGWKMFVDGVETPYFRANAVLRSACIKSGNHEIVWEFIPTTYLRGRRIALISSGIVLLCLFGAAGWTFRKKKTLSAQA